MIARIAALALTGLVLLLSSCDIFTPGGGGIDLTFEMSASAPLHVADGSSSTPVECAVEFRTTATGPADAVAVWEGGELRRFEGTSRTSPVAVIRLSTQEVAALWEREILRSGQEAVVVWNFWSDRPFVVEAEFRYSTGSGGREGRITGRVGCGLDPAMAQAPAPTVSDVVVVTPDPFQPGDSFTVSYSAAGAAGLWRTLLTIEGAYSAQRLIDEGFVSDVRRTVEFVVPPGITLGVPLTISVTAVDALQQESAPATGGSVGLEDRTPPWYLYVSTKRHYHDYLPAWLVGQYGVGDTLMVNFHTADNHALGGLAWEIGSARGTHPLDGPWMADQLRLPVASGWRGTPGLAIAVSDASGNAGPRHEAHPDSIRIFPVVSRPTLEWSTEGSVVGAAWDEDRDLLYLALQGASSILVLSTASMTPDRQIPLPGPVGGLDLTPTGDSLVVALSDRASLGIVTLSDDRLVEIDLSRMGLHDPEGVLSLAGERVFVTARHPDGMRLVEIDVASGARTIRYDGLPSEHVWRMHLARNTDRSMVAVRSNDVCLIAYSSSTDSFGECAAAGSAPGTLSANPAGTHVLVGSRLVAVASGAGGEAVWGLQNGGEVSAFSADGSSLYLSDVKGVMKVRIADGVVVERIPMPIVYGRILPAASGGRMLTVGTDLDSWPYAVVVRRVALR